MKTWAASRRNRTQFKLSTLLVLIALGCGAAWLGARIKSAVDQRHSVEALEAAGASVQFGPPRTRFARSSWLRSLLGDAALLDVTHVNCPYHVISDDDLTHLEPLAQLSVLEVAGPKVTDVGIAHVQSLTQLTDLLLERTGVSDDGLGCLEALKRLRLLSLSDTQVSDAGLWQLRGLTRLETLDLGGTRVTDQGVGDFRRALPEVEIRHRPNDFRELFLTCPELILIQRTYRTGTGDLRSVGPAGSETRAERNWLRRVRRLG